MNNFNIENFLDLVDYATDERIAMDIMLRNLVCHDFFTWNFEEWRQMTDDEIKQSKKK